MVVLSGLLLMAATGVLLRANTGDPVGGARRVEAGPGPDASGTPSAPSDSGGITANAPGFFSLCGTRVTGPTPAPTTALTVTNAPVAIRVGDPASACAGDNFAGKVVLTGNVAVTFGANSVSESATINNNGTGSTVVKANNLCGTLACSGHSPVPTNAGQVNTALSKTGQCAAL